MLLNLVFAALFAGMSLYMIGSAHFEITRRVAFVLVGACLMELLATGLLSLTAHPLLTVLSLAARLSLLACGVGAVRADRAMAKRRAEHRRAFSRKYRCSQHPLQVVPGKSTAGSVKTVRCA